MDNSNIATEDMPRWVQVTHAPHATRAAALNEPVSLSCLAILFVFGGIFFYLAKRMVDRARKYLIKSLWMPIFVGASA